MDAGTLYIVATPIGNLGDITLRALETLRLVDAVLAEDTRCSIKLLNHYQIKKQLISCHKFNESARTQEIVEQLQSGRSLALVADAGTPGISDAGALLVGAVRAAGLTVVPLPGASAITTLISAAGKEVSALHFVGFLAPKRVARCRALGALAGVNAHLVLYESPHRIKALLADIETELGGRSLVVGRELTKRYEEFICGSPAQVLGELEAFPERCRGEFALLVAPPKLKETGPGVAPEVLEIAAKLVCEHGLSAKDAAAVVAQLAGVPKRQVYQYLHRDA